MLVCCVCGVHAEFVCVCGGGCACCVNTPCVRREGRVCGVCKRCVCVCVCVWVFVCVCVEGGVHAVFVCVCVCRVHAVFVCGGCTPCVGVVCTPCL